MGLSLSVLVALAFILPGAAFVFGLSRLHSPTNPTTLLDQHVSVGLAIAVLATLTIHALWLALMRAFMAAYGYPIPDPGQLLALLAGDVTSAAGLDALASFRNYPVRIASYLASLTLVAWYLGKGVNRRLRKKETASWFDLLRPTGAVFVWLTTDLQLGERCYLYAGWVKQFSVAKDGTIERVVLGYAVRKPMYETPPVEGISIGSGWIEIPGEHCVLQMAGARTVNVDYFFPDEMAESGSVDQAAANDEHSQPASTWSLSQFADPSVEGVEGNVSDEPAARRE